MANLFNEQHENLNNRMFGKTRIQEVTQRAIEKQKDLTLYETRENFQEALILLETIKNQTLPNEEKFRQKMPLHIQKVHAHFNFEFLIALMKKSSNPDFHNNHRHLR